ncbi:MAG TPA: class I SAM-dependent methyltransferase [Actinospica sp.]|jgi:predicted O-methyltransferase YrrM|nr:class I SAM-dependent methyltransferase [Actinospica sp.]
MSTTGTASYTDLDVLPPLVHAAVSLARTSGFAYSCLPAHGRLLQLLAGGVADGVIGETGTGCGVGLGWLAEGASPGTRLLSIERDPERAARAAALFAGRPNVSVLNGDWRELREHGPFDLLALDGGGQAKGGDPAAEAADPAQWLKPGGLLVLDDFSPLAHWPPLFQGEPDTARLHWLEHPRLRATQVNVTPGASTLLATFLG